MNREVVLVTGCSGLVGKFLVNHLNAPSSTISNVSTCFEAFVLSLCRRRMSYFVTSEA
jgi:nucleoside-diphosphate-sugar epimerase